LVWLAHAAPVNVDRAAGALDVTVLRNRSRVVAECLRSRFFSRGLWDGMLDPLIGLLSDRTQGPYARRKPWMAVGTPFIMIATLFLYQPAGEVGFGYLLFWVSFNSAWTMVQLPHLSSGAVPG